MTNRNVFDRRSDNVKAVAKFLVVIMLLLECLLPGMAGEVS